MKQNKIDSNIILDDYSVIKECVYRGEKYSVRNNGAVFRHKQDSECKPRPLDEKWTFGKKDSSNGYLMIGSHRVHIIVATAFSGEHDTKKFIVDHIDSNRDNNRPENLRWMTRLEKALMNPVTYRRIEFLCGGDINRFISAPCIIRNSDNAYQDLMWMSSVTSEEALNAFRNVKEWSKKINPYIGRNMPIEKNVSWSSCNNYENLRSLYYDNRVSAHIDETQNNAKEEKMTYYDSKTPSAKQLCWKTPTEFPLCPLSSCQPTLDQYVANLEVGKIVTKNEYCEHVIDDFRLVGDSLYIRTHALNSSDQIKPYSLIRVILENGFFCHEGTLFFEKKGAQKYFKKAIGEKWTGGYVFDDYC